MNLLYIYYVAVQFGLLTLASWLLACNRSLLWGIPLGLLWFGACGNLVVLLHVGYGYVWPTEVAIASGGLQLLATMIFSHRTLATRPPADKAPPADGVA